jgi:hypothetical protein
MPAMRQVDLCVIGSGPGGQKAAIQAAKLGKRVCVVERREQIGGVAVHTGTIPSKALREMILRAGGIRSAVPRMQDFLAAGRSAALKQLWAYYDKVIQTETQIVQKQLAKNQIEVVYGSARFADPHTVEVVSQTATETIAAGRSSSPSGASRRGRRRCPSTASTSSPPTTCSGCRRSALDRDRRRRRDRHRVRLDAVSAGRARHAHRGPAASARVRSTARSSKRCSTTCASTAWRSVSAST